MKTNIIILFVLLSAALRAQGQTLAVQGDSLQWHVTSFTDVPAQKDTVLASDFKTYGAAIDWIQDSGNQVYTYTVTSADGTWADAQSDGDITFHVSWHTMTGTLRFTRSGGVTSVTMNFEKEGSIPMSYVFNVSQVSKIVQP